MQAGLVYIAGAAGKMVVTSTISPVVQSTVTLITSLRTSTGGTDTLQEVIQKRDITCTLQTIEATMIALKCDKEPLKTAAEHVLQQIQQIHQLLTKIADITAAHQAGYISRWRQLYLDAEIEQLKNYMDILAKRFKLLCDIRGVVN
tara:strand:- start:1018 stop:1455 length:438 start_codon:yes stop_codon:yes gene_type:complete